MKFYLNWNDAQELEQPSQSHGRFSVKLNDMWQRAIAYVASEPHVWRTQDHLGRVVWSAYSPVTGQSISRVSASEMRTWLEEQHYQHEAIAYQNAEQFKSRQMLRSF